MNQKLNPKHLTKLFTNAQGVILWKMIKLIKKNEYLILDDSGTKYIKQSYKDWIGDIKIPFANGATHCISVSCFANHLRKLVENNLVFRFNDRACKMALYGIKEKDLIKKLDYAFPYLGLKDKETFANCEIDDVE